MKKFVIFTIGFPYENYEPFLQNELLYLGDVTIVSSYIGDKTSYNKKLNDNVLVLHPDNLFFKGNRIVRFFAAFRVIFTKVFWYELFSKEIRPINIKKIAQLLSGISKAQSLYLNKDLNDLLAQYKNNEEIVLYSYWMNQLALCAYWFSKKYKIAAITRCHGYDVYPRKENNYYVTFQKYLLGKMNHIFSISEDGKNRLLTLDKTKESIITVSRLGTIKRGETTKAKNEYFTIVSCSNVTELKRVDLIAKALSLIVEFKVRWVHFGDGPLFDYIKEIIDDLPSNIDVCLRGRVLNTEVIDFYKNNEVDLFVNVSVSEGIPVSIMEAMSYGIPCLATNVGGTHEIVNKSNGWLVDPDINPKLLSDYFISVIKMDSSTKKEYQKNALNKWKNDYNGEQNYMNFRKILEELGK